MNKIFNSTLENALRIIVLMNNVVYPISLSRIISYDFIALNAKSYDTGDYNVNGDNEYGLAEYSLKQKKISDAAKYLVRNNFIKVSSSVGGFRFEITDKGKCLADGLHCQYSEEYITNLKKVINRFEGISDKELFIYLTSVAEGQVYDEE